MKSINATHYELIPTYPSKDDRKQGVIHAIVETTKGSPYKFALEARLGIIAFHAALPDGYRWPYDYGFIPQTLGEDGDPLDAIVMLDCPTFSGCLLAGTRPRRDPFAQERRRERPLRHRAASGARHDATDGSVRDAERSERRGAQGPRRFPVRLLRKPGKYDRARRRRRSGGGAGADPGRTQSLYARAGLTRRSSRPCRPARGCPATYRCIAAATIRESCASTSAVAASPNCARADSNRQPRP